MEFSSKHRGADVPHRKSTAQMESSILPPPGQVILPMQQHAGAPCKPLVKIGDEVLVGQKNCGQRCLYRCADPRKHFRKGIGD